MTRCPSIARAHAPGTQLPHTSDGGMPVRRSRNSRRSDGATNTEICLPAGKPPWTLSRSCAAWLASSMTPQLLVTRQATGNISNGSRYLRASSSRPCVISASASLLRCSSSLVCFHLGERSAQLCQRLRGDSVRGLLRAKGLHVWLAVGELDRPRYFNANHCPPAQDSRLNELQRIAVTAFATHVKTTWSSWVNSVERRAVS